MSSENGEASLPLFQDILPFPDDKADMLRFASCGRNIALILALTRESHLYSGRDLTDYLVSTIEETQRDPNTFTRSYASSRIKSWPDDVVTTIENDQEFAPPRWLYSATSRAREFDAPFAAQVAKKCWEYELAPALLLVSPSGQTRKPNGLSSNVTRIAMYDALLRSDAGEELSVTELAERSGVPTRIIHNHIGSIDRANIVDLLYTEARSQYPKYTSNIGNGPDEITTEYSGFNASKRRLVTHIHRAIQDGEIDTADIRVADIHQLLADEYRIDGFVKSKLSYKQNEAIAEVLEFLEEEGVIVEQSPGTPRLSKLRISEFGREIVGHYFSLLNGLINEDRIFLENGKRIGQEIVTDSKRMSWLLTVDQEVGAIAPKRRQEVRGSELIAIVGDFELSTAEIEKLSGEKRRLTFSVLKALEGSGKLKSRQLGRDVLWSQA